MIAKHGAHGLSLQQSHDTRLASTIFEHHPSQSQCQSQYQTTDASASYRGERGAEAPNYRDFDVTFNDSCLMSFFHWP